MSVLEMLAFSDVFHSYNVGDKAEGSRLGFDWMHSGIAQNVDPSLFALDSCRLCWEACIIFSVI